MKTLKTLTTKVVLPFIFSSASVFAYQRPVVYDFNVESVQEDKIMISWKLSGESIGDSATGIFIFRDSKPLENVHKMIPIAVLPPDQENYLDSPGDFREYFYAAVVTTNKSMGTKHLVDGEYYYDEQLDALPYEKDMLLPGINCTIEGTRVQGIVHSAENLEAMQKSRLSQSLENKDYSKVLREKPLPLMEFPGEKNDTHLELDAQDEKRVKKILGDKGFSKKVLEPYIFPEDKVADKSSIPVGKILSNKFSEAEHDLEDYLRKAKTKNDAYNRAKFYLAQCHYFTGDFEKSSMEFALLQDVFPRLSLKWARSSLNLMEDKSQDF